MSRRRRAERRDVLPDSRYGDKLVTKFINSLMYDGKKSISESIFYTALDQITAETNEEGIDVFRKAMDNLKPQLEVRWLIRYSRERKEYGMIEKLRKEIIAAANNEGGAMKKKDDTYKMAEANRAFAHYRW